MNLLFDEEFELLCSSISKWEVCIWCWCKYYALVNRKTSDNLIYKLQVESEHDEGDLDIKKDAMKAIMMRQVPDSSTYIIHEF